MYGQVPRDGIKQTINKGVLRIEAWDTLASSVWYQKRSPEPGDQPLTNTRKIYSPYGYQQIVAGLIPPVADEVNSIMVDHCLPRTAKQVSDWLTRRLHRSRGNRRGV